MPEEKFETVKEFRSTDGVVAVITARTKNGRKNYTYALRKEYDAKDGGGVAQTPWLQKKHLNSVRVLLDAVEEFIQHEEDKDRAKYRTVGIIG